MIRNYKRVARAVGGHRQSMGATVFTIADYTGYTGVIRNYKRVALGGQCAQVVDDVREHLDECAPEPRLLRLQHPPRVLVSTHVLGE